MGSCQSSGSPSDANATKQTAKNDSLGTREVFPECDNECAVGDSLTGGNSKPLTESNTREKIKLWKEELEASGNLTKTVVNIEVSIVLFIRAILCSSLFFFASIGWGFCFISLGWRLIIAFASFSYTKIQCKLTYQYIYISDLFREAGRERLRRGPQRPDPRDRGRRDCSKMPPPTNRDSLCRQVPQHWVDRERRNHRGTPGGSLYHVPDGSSRYNTTRRSL